jgi:hypothetical protein
MATMSKYQMKNEIQILDKWKVQSLKITFEKTYINMLTMEVKEEI